MIIRAEKKKEFPSNGIVANIQIAKKSVIIYICHFLFWFPKLHFAMVQQYHF